MQLNEKTETNPAVYSSFYSVSNAPQKLIRSNETAVAHYKMTHPHVPYNICTC